MRFADYQPLPADGPTGHPEGLGWFCRRHLRAARAASSETLGGAVAAMRRRVAGAGLVVAVSAALAIAGHYLEGGRWLAYVFKPLTTLAILAVAARARAVPAGYRVPIVLGLAFALVGDVLLMLPADRFVAGLASFAVTHVCYLTAFRSDARLGGQKLPFLLLAGVAAGVLALLWPGLGPGLGLPVAVYAVLLAAMAAQAVSRALELDTAGSRLAAAGALLFLLSDTLLAVDRFRFPLAADRVAVLATYWAAQWLIAWSVVRHGSGGGEPPG